MFTSLQKVAKVSLGYKSLQNDFFYVNAAAASTYGIESRFLKPVFMLKDLAAQKYSQEPKPSVWLFACRETREDLRGTGAWRYIEAMADRPAANRKQSGPSLTIRGALEAQSGGLWYAPKAKPAHHHIWLRKAVNSVYAPLLFEEATLLDQRLNSVSPNEGIDWREVAAALTSSLFVYSLEINGAASLGAGALEAPTTKLRDYPVIDIPALKPSSRKELVALAEDVWSNERPLDWASDKWKPQKCLRLLDEWVLKTAGKSVTVDQMYDDIRSTCLARIGVAEDKTRKTKRQESESIGSVAAAIASIVDARLKTRNFPDDFASSVKLDLPLLFDRGLLGEINIEKLLDSYEIRVRAKGGSTLYLAAHPKPVAEAIVRAILLGRSTFSVSTDRDAMGEAIESFLRWVAEAEGVIETAIAESAFGTGYEDALKKEVYVRLGIHPMTGAKELPGVIAL